MSVFRIHKNKNYTVMSNYHLQDKNLSFKAKGLLSYMLSLPDDWNYTINGLVANSKEGVKAIKNILKELQEYRYLTITKKKNNKGQFEYEYEIYEKPEYPFVEVDNVALEKGILQNTNNKILNKKKTTKKKKTNTNKANFTQREYTEEQLNELVGFNNITTAETSDT